VRGWDKAGPTGDGDFTAGVRISRANGVFHVEDVIRDEWGAGAREQTIKQAA
jgi:phage terminase large subunit-like protein